MPDNSGAVDLSALSPEEQDAVKKMAEENPTEEPEGSYPGDQNPEDNRRKVLTGFIVLVDYNGNPEVMSLPEHLVLVQSEPTPDLIYAACGVIQKDLAAQETAHATAEVMMQQARAMQEQMQAAHLAQQVKGGLRV